MESDNVTQVLITQLELGGPKAVLRHKTCDWLLQLLCAKQLVCCHIIILHVMFVQKLLHCNYIPVSFSLCEIL